ncbi:MAG: alpha/beta hydrolase [Candidatus Hydrogenedentes bacterium]|nr:alpha/beta hydrolase [Candidatus Hydrogenedentota bacterium]
MSSARTAQPEAAGASSIRAATQWLQRRIVLRRRMTKLALLLLILAGVWAGVSGVLGVLVLIVGAFALTVVLYPFLVGDLEVTPLSDHLRAQWPDELFVRLSQGVTHYQLAGPENGPRVVLVVGFASPYFIWDHQFQALASAGFRVLRYDNFGRGLSDRPNVVYNDDLFDTQLLELLDALHWNGPVDLVGLSMGGATVARFVDRHPERARRYVMIAPAGLPQRLRPRQHLLRIPGVGEWLMKIFGDENILQALPAEVGNDAEKVRRAIDEYVNQMQYQGYKRALLSTWRHNPLAVLLPVFERLGSQPRLGLLLWGTKDTIVPFEQHVRLQAAIPAIRFHAIEGGTHPVNYHMPEAVNPILIDFLSR